jgi:hypothetical protein
MLVITAFENQMAGLSKVPHYPLPFEQRVHLHKLESKMAGLINTCKNATRRGERTPCRQALGCSWIVLL